MKKMKVEWVGGGVIVNIFLGLRFLRLGFRYFQGWLRNFGGGGG